MRPLVAMNDRRAIARAPLLDGHSQRVRHQRRGRLGIDRPADDAPAEGVEHNRAVHLPFACRVLGNVGDPELISLVPCELTLDTVFGSGDVGDPTISRPPGEALQMRSPHQQLDSLFPDRDAPAYRQLGMNPTQAVCAAGFRMNSCDDIGEPSMADSPLRGRTTAPAVVTGDRDAQNATRHLHREPVCGDHLDRRVRSFGVDLLLQQFRRPTVDRKLGLQLSDSSLGRYQLCMLGGR